MDAWGYAAFFLVAFAASFLQTSIGFGFSVFSMLFLPYFLPYADSVVLAQTIALINTIVVAVCYRRHIAWKKMLPLLLPTMIAGGAAAVLMLDIDSSYLMLALGILLIFLSASFFILSDRIHFQPNAIAGVALGVRLVPIRANVVALPVAHWTGHRPHPPCLRLVERDRRFNRQNSLQVAHKSLFVSL